MYASPLQGRFHRWCIIEHTRLPMTETLERQHCTGKCHVIILKACLKGLMEVLMLNHRCLQAIFQGGKSCFLNKRRQIGTSEAFTSICQGLHLSYLLAACLRVDQQRSTKHIARHMEPHQSQAYILMCSTVLAIFCV